MDCKVRNILSPQVEHDAALTRVITIPLASFNQDRHGPWAFLSPSEIKQANRYRSAVRRNAYIAGRAAVRLLLSYYWRRPPATFCLCLSRQGKPLVQCNDGMLYAGFNLSHSPSQLVVGITPRASIGVDVEDFHRGLRSDLLVRNYFSISQQEEWLDYPVEQRERAFLRGWTRKEAAWKSFGNENVVAWNDIEVTLEDTQNTCLRARTATGENLLLDCYTWELTENSLASIVVRRNPPKELILDVQTFDFDELSELVWTSDHADRLRPSAVCGRECSRGD